MASFMALLFAWNNDDDRHPFFNYISHVTSALESRFYGDKRSSIKNYFKSREFPCQEHKFKSHKWFTIVPQFALDCIFVEERNAKTNKFIMRMALCAEAPDFSSWKSVAINQITLFHSFRSL